MGIEHAEKKTGRQGTTVKAKYNKPSEMSGSHRHRGGFHEKSESPSVHGNWGAKISTQTGGHGILNTPTSQDTGLMALGQILAQKTQAPIQGRHMEPAPRVLEAIEILPHAQAAPSQRGATTQH